MSIGKLFIFLPVILISGCFGTNLDFGPEPTRFYYSEPSNSGLSAIRPYPDPHDVCQVIREHKAIREPIDNGTFLIACPKHERNAIEDRLDEGAQIIGHARHWTILTVANS